MEWITALKWKALLKKIIATNQEKYGCDWQMQSPEIMQKSYQTTLERYGVRSVPCNITHFLQKRCLPM